MTRELMTVKQFCERFAWARPGGLRAQLFNRKQNGMDALRVIVQQGRKVLVDVHRYFEWLDKYGNSAGGNACENTSTSKG